MLGVLAGGRVEVAQVVPPAQIGSLLLPRARDPKPPVLSETTDPSAPTLEADDCPEAEHRSHLGEDRRSQEEVVCDHIVGV